MLPPEPRGRVPRGFLKNVDFPLDRTEGSSYNTTVRDVSRTTSYPGVAQLVARMVRDHEAVSSNLATRTMQSVLIGSEYPVMDTLLFYFLKSSYCKAFRGVAECYAFSRFHDNTVRFSGSGSLTIEAQTFPIQSGGIETSGSVDLTLRSYMNGTVTRSMAVGAGTSVTAEAQGNNLDFYALNVKNNLTVNGTLNATTKGCVYQNDYWRKAELYRKVFRVAKAVR